MRQSIRSLWTSVSNLLRRRLVRPLLPPSGPLPPQDRSPEELQALLLEWGRWLPMSASEARSLAMLPRPPGGPPPQHRPPDPACLDHLGVLESGDFLQILRQVVRHSRRLPRLIFLLEARPMTFAWPAEFLRHHHPAPPCPSPFLLPHRPPRNDRRPYLRPNSSRRPSRPRLRRRPRLMPWNRKRRVLPQFRKPFRPRRRRLVTGLRLGRR